MIHSLSLFFTTFLNPFERDEGGEKISYFEVMGISWSLHILYALYSVFALYLGLMSYEYLSSSPDFTHLLFASLNMSLQKMGLMWMGLQVIFYPFVFQLAFKFWAFILKFYAQLFEYESEGDLELEIEDLLNSVFTANIFLIIPIFGNVLSLMAMSYYLFVNLRKKLSLTRMQATLVLATPLFAVFLFTILIASYIAFLFSLL